MPDISMCAQEKCPVRRRCYRHEATPSEWRQSYFAPKYGPTGCDHFWPVDPAEVKVTAHVPASRDQDRGGNG